MCQQLKEQFQENLKGIMGLRLEAWIKWLNGSKNDPTTRPRIHPKMGMGVGVKSINEPMKILKSKSFLLELYQLQTSFIMLVRKLILFTNIEVNTHHGLTIHSLLHYVQFMLNLANISSYHYMQKFKLL